MDDKTLSYYENNAEQFIQGTLNADISDLINQFIALLPAKACVLDFGCGSGRDAKLFLEKGYSVEAIDGSAELCRYANEILGVPAKQMYFNELSGVDKYDGIWACSSILHLPKNELKEVFVKMLLALKQKGTIYTSFKYGNFEGYRGDRYFTDFTEKTFGDFLSDYSNVEIVKEWVSPDVRPGRENEKWLNLILRKTE